MLMLIWRALSGRPFPVADLNLAKGEKASEIKFIGISLDVVRY
jgi:hypothetical protein